jgi:hypothetical protein
MDVIGHQAVREDPHPVGSGVFREKFEIGPPKWVACEHVLTSVPTLRDVVWKANCHHPRLPRHVYVVLMGGRGSQRVRDNLV